jgi:hypothetical protein
LLAHAFGQRYELPIPLLLFVLGGAAVVLVSFLLVMGRPVMPEADEVDEPPAGRERVRLLPPNTIPGLLSVVFLVLLVACGLFGSQDVASNLVPTVFWLVVWIAVPLSCGLLGDWTKPVNPFAVLAKVADRPGLRRRLLGGEEPIAWPDRIGWWPAVAVYFFLASAELIFNVTATVPRNIAVALACYAVLSAAAGLLFGEAWLSRGEVFSVILDTWGRIGYFRFGAAGRRGFAGGLASGFDRSMSRSALVLLLLVSVNFDGLLATPRWALVERHAVGLVSQDSPRLETFRTMSFVVLALVVTAVFTAFATAAIRLAHRRSGPEAALSALLPSLLPIAFGYLLAHNVQYLVVNSQLLLPLIGNPTGSPTWPISLPYPFNDGYEPNLQVLPGAFYWYLAIVVIVGVHVVAVVLAHVRLGAEAAIGQAARRSGELPWLAAMVGYTMVSLWLLAQPLVQESVTSVAEARSPAAGVSASARR